MPPATRKAALALFAVVLAVYLFTAGGSFATTDAMVTYDQTKQLVEARSVALSHDLIGNQAYRGPDGRYYSPFGVLQSIYNVPFYLAGRAGASALAHGATTSDMIPKAVVALGNTVPMACAIWLTCLFAYRLSGSTSAAVLTALFIALGSPAWVYAKFGYNAPLATLWLVAASYETFAALRHGPERRLLLAGLSLGMALLTRHELVAGGVAIAAFVAIESGGNLRLIVRRLLALGAGFAPAAIGWLAWNAVRFGNPLQTGYLRDVVPGFGSSISAGLYGLLLSPTASVFAYCPLVLLGCAALIGLARRDRAAAVLLGGQALVLLLIYAQLENWRAGRSFGPRYLVPAIPLVCLPLACWFSAAPRRARGLLVAACVASVVWTLPGVLVDFSKVGLARARADGAPSAEQRLYDWSRSPLVENLGASAVALPANFRYLVGLEPPPSIVGRQGEATPEVGQQLAFGVDFWWVSAFYLGFIGRGVALVIGGLGLAIIGLLGRRLVRLTKDAA
jgi:hypothetical protein